MIAGRPLRLVLISTGNIGNDVLERRLFEHLAGLEQSLEEPGFVGLAAEGLIIHQS